MRETEIAVVGGGPANLSAALAAARLGARVTIIDSNDALGGQLVKQTHKFFGSKRQHAGVRGIAIGATLTREAMANPNIEVMAGATAVGLYPGLVIGIDDHDTWTKLRARAVIVATGASERMIPFENNDLPGVYGAGAVQTLMNLYGVLPGRNVLMVGAGNIGLIVSYQLLQAGVNVAAVVEAAPRIGGYLVHAAKLRRAQVPILTSHTIIRAHGEEVVEAATISRVDENWRPVPGTERTFDVDVICLAVGLTPTADLLWQAGCEMRWHPGLSGHVPLRDEDLLTTVPGIYVAGDAAGVEEASSAMLEGEIAGISAALSLGYGGEDAERLRREAKAALAELRSGPTGAKVRDGVAAVTIPRSVLKGGACS